MIQDELDRSNILAQSNFFTLIVEILNREVTIVTKSRFRTRSIFFGNLPTCIIIKVILAEISWQYYSRLKLIRSIYSQLRVAKTQFLLNITYSYVECTSIWVVQCTIIVNSVYTETDDVALYVVHILDSNSTLITLEQLSWLTVVTNILISIRIPSIQL